MATDPSVLINAAIARNQELTQAAIRASGDVMTAASGRISPPAGFQGTTPLLHDVPVSSPDISVLPVEFLDAYNTLRAQLTTELGNEITGYLNDYFPGVMDLTETCDDWLQNTITNGGTGIPFAIERAIWDRARGREMIEAVRMEQEAVNQFASRGFSMPPGAMAYRMMEIQQDAANKSSTLSRDIAVKNVEIEIANIKFAIEQGLQVRFGVLKALNDYLQLLLKKTETNIDYAKAVTDVKSKLLAAASDYYRAMIAEANLEVQVMQLRQTSGDAMVGYEVSAYTQFVKGQIGAAATIANVIASAAAGALNAVGSIVGSQDYRIGPIVP